MFGDYYFNMLSRWYSTYMSTQDSSACRASQDEGVSVYHRMSFIACKYFRNGHDNILGTHINKLYYITHTSTGPLSVCTLQVVLSVLRENDLDRIL